MPQSLPSLFLPLITIFLACVLALPAPFALESNVRVPGCGKTLILKGIEVKRPVAKDRSYWYRLPLNYDKNRAYPVVMGFHGSSKVGASIDGLFFAADSGLSWPRYSADKIIVYPNGKSGVWAGPSYGVATVEEDLQYVRDILADLNNTVCVDTQRVYATGHSNGGGFVGTLACSDVSHYFAAFAPVSGAFYTDNGNASAQCHPRRLPVPMLSIHGGSDTSVPYGGGQGEGGMLPSIDNWLERWVARDNCGAESAPLDTFGGDVHLRSWDCDEKKGLLQHYKVDSMGHQWPSASITFSGIADGKGPTKIDGNRIILDFFALWTKDGAVS